MDTETKAVTRSPLKTKSLTNNEVIGKYLLGAELGRGAFGAVYRGLDTVSGKTVAIKQMKLEKGQQQSTLQREIEFMKQFEHENILQYYESIVVKSKINIVIEYMENGSLSDIIEQFGVFPEPLVATYLFQVLTGLQFLHENKVIHKDIKAANILLAKDGTIKLADFGIAYQISEDHNTPIKGIQGSPFWMSPEVITNDSTPTTKSDIWSIGCTIIELLMGSPPWGEESAVSVVWKIVEGDITTQYPPIITNELKDLLNGCFERSVNSRPSAETLLKHPWIAKFSLGSFKRSLADLRKTVQQHTRKSMMFGGLNPRSVPSSPIKAPKEYAKDFGEDTPLLLKTPETTPVSTITSVDEQLNLGLDIRGVSVFFLETISKSDGPKSWTEYVVKVSLGTMKWRIEKRYSQFRALHENVSNAFKTYHSKVVLPIFPPKRTFGNLDPKFVLERRIQLQLYMDQLLAKSEVLACPEVKCFLIGD